MLSADGARHPSCLLVMQVFKGPCHVVSVFLGQNGTEIKIIINSNNNL